MKIEENCFYKSNTGLDLIRILRIQGDVVYCRILTLVYKTDDKISNHRYINDFKLKSFRKLSLNYMQLHSRNLVKITKDEYLEIIKECYDLLIKMEQDLENETIYD